MNRVTDSVIRVVAALALAASTGAGVAHAQVQVKAQIAPGAAPPWEKGILPISSESYYHAIECGKQGGNPPCVFWDAGLCKNSDFELSMYSPYKMVSYEVWSVVRQKQPAPQPSYSEAQRTRVTIGVAPVGGAKNVLTDFVLKRGGKPVAPTARTLSGGTGRYTFDYPAFAPTASVVLEMIGKDQTVVCTIDPATLRRMR